MKKTVPFSKEQAEELIASYGSPLHIYVEQGIRETAQGMKKAFGWAKGYKNYFAVKATPTPAIMKVLHEEGMGFDCSSKAELEMMRRLGIGGGDIIFTSNNTPIEDFKTAIELGATINIDDATQVPVFMKALGSRSLRRVCLRYNPGAAQSGNELIGTPEDAKYGFRLDQLSVAYNELKKANIKEFGLHTMVVSNETDPDYFQKTALLLSEAAKKIEMETGIQLISINLGGGLGIAYHPDDRSPDLEATSNAIKQELEHLDKEIHTEYGRFVTGPHGYLLTQVRYVMDKYKKYVGVDASMQNLMRPGMYGAYHHISVLGKELMKKDLTADVVGALCENNDKFAVDRKLPAIERGDLMVLHDAGAHGHAMGFNYNGMLRSAEVLLRSDGSHELIRRAETLEDYFSTIVW